MSSNLKQLIRLIRCSQPRCSWCCQRTFYDWRTRSDTIFAPATSIQPIKGSPLGVIRVSGSKTVNVLREIIRHEPLRDELQANETKLQNVSETMKLRPRHATLTKIYDPRSDKNDIVDLGLVLWFPNPRSYTGEDSCEFHLHGSQVIIKRLMTILGEMDGFRPAEPGEFTRRAVENGKLNLIQAESLPELIAAQTDQQRKLALQGLLGSTRAKYDTWISRLVKILAHLEASIDFGEDDLIGEEKVVRECTRQLGGLASEISDFVSISSRCRDLIQLGVRVSILGKPNAGKSTLMNILCRQEKSIVSDLSGTTRDVIEHSFELGGHTLTLCDTAGLNDLHLLASDDSQETNKTNGGSKRTVIAQHAAVEREGVKRALNNAGGADLIIYLVDASRLTKESSSSVVDELMQVLKSVGPERQRKRALHLVMNKMDLGKDSCQIATELRANQLLKSNSINVTPVSCKTQENIDRLVERISEDLDKLQRNAVELVRDRPMDYVNERHLSLLRSTARHLDRARRLDIRTIDEMAQHVRESVDYLSRIMGTVTNEQVVDIIFRDFCIGK